MAYTTFQDWLRGTYGFGTNHLLEMDRDRRRRIEDAWEQYYRSQTAAPAPAPTAPAPAAAPAPYTPPAPAPAPDTGPTYETDTGAQTVYNYPTFGVEQIASGDADVGMNSTSPWGSPIGTQTSGGSGQAVYSAQQSGGSGQSVYDPQAQGSSGPAQWGNMGWNQGSWGGYAQSGQVANNIFGGQGTQTSTEHPFYDPNSSYWQNGTGQPTPSNLFGQANTELQRQYSNQNPEGYYMYWLGQQGLGGLDARSQAAQSMYRDAMSGYGAAKVNNAELDLADYLRMWDVQRLLSEMSYDQLGMGGTSQIGGRNRWGMRAT